MENPAVAQLAEAIDLKSIKCEFESHLPDQLLNTILKRIVISGECVLWTGAITKSTGYGKIKWMYKAYDVHRLIANYVFGLLERKDEVCHTLDCNYRHCIRLKHLYKGTRSSNMLDSVKKGTHNSHERKGVVHFEHGTDYGYDCGCKCSECMRAHRNNVYSRRINGPLIK